MFPFLFQNVVQHTTLSVVFSVTYYLEYTMLSLSTAYLILYQQMSMWLFGNYIALTTLCGNKSHQ